MSAPRVETSESIRLAHELRTPLNAIKSWTHVLESHLRDADPEIRRALDGIMIGVDQQVRLIEALLEHPGKGDSMAGSEKHDRSEERPNRPEPETKPDTMEGPGGRRERKAEEEERNKTTRRGED